MLARDVMAAEPATIAPNAPLHAVAAAMVERGATGLPVVDGACGLLGLVTESDLLHRLAAVEQKQHGYLWGVFHSIRRQADEYARARTAFLGAGAPLPATGRRSRRAGSSGSGTPRP